MRVQLSIHRHALPVVSIVWPIKDLKSTVAGLLQQVNEVIQLESLEYLWGLEDYTVLYEGSELLHFFTLQDVVKDNDHLLIRPLTTTEVRQRRLGGREQISADGRHLRDGIPFGRPWLRAPARPDIRIPPRKRVRMISPDNTEEDTQDMLLNSGANDALPKAFTNLLTFPKSLTETNRRASKEVSRRTTNTNWLQEILNKNETFSGFSDDDSEDSEDSEEDSSSTSENDFLDNMLAAFAPHMSQRPTGNGGRKRKADVLSDTNGIDKSLVQDSKKAVSGVSANGENQDRLTNMVTAFAKRIAQSRGNHGYEKKRADAVSGASKNDYSSRALLELEDEDDDDDDDEDYKGFEDEEEEEDSTSSNSSNMEAEYVNGSGFVETESDDETGMRAVRQSQDSKQLDSILSNILLDAEDVSTSSDTESDLDVSDTSDDDEESSHLSTSSEDSSEEDSDESSSEDDEITEIKSNAVFTQTHTAVPKPASSQTLSAKGDVVKPSPNINGEKRQSNDKVISPVPPGSGKKETKSRNDRRKRNAKLARLIKTGILPVGSTVHGLAAWEEAQSDGNATSLAPGTLRNPLSEIPRTEGEEQGDLEKPETEAVVDSQAVIAQSARRLDKSSAARMIFGSLGVRTPKTAAEGEEVRAKLASRYDKDHNSPNDVPATLYNGTDPELDASPESTAWEAKIEVKAVECEAAWIGDDGDDRYTAPPYPFEQMWDPVARDIRDSLKRDHEEREARNKKRKRAQQDYIEDREDSELVAYPELPYDDEDVRPADDEAAQSQLLGEASNMIIDDKDDLPALPDDLATLQSAHLSDLREGAIIVFKQLEVSAATNWTPQLSSFRTAEVLSCMIMDENEAELNLRLAKRDWPSRNRPVEFDDQGKRIYGKFEMEGLSDDGADESIIEVQLGELVELKILQAAPQRDIDNGEDQEENRISEGAEQTAPVQPEHKK